jgi:hypothetical protein
MTKVLKQLLLPVGFFLLLTAEECDNPDIIEEEVTVLPDGTVETRFQHRALQASRILDSDPPPSLEAGWDSVHVGLVREDNDDLFFLRAWTRYPPGTDLPVSNASPRDSLGEWYVRFPSQLETEEVGDTVFFHYRRTYPALPWSPTGLMETFGERAERAEEALEALEESGGSVFEEKWEASGLLDQAEEEGDSVTLRQYQREFKEVLFRGAPSPIESYQDAVSTWMRYSLFGDLAFAIPAGEIFCRGSHADAVGKASELVTGVVGDFELSVDQTLLAVLEEADIEPDPTVFPSLPVGEFDFWGDPRLEVMTDRTLDAVRDAFRKECGLSGKDLIEFDRRFAWLTDRYGISDGEVRSQAFGFYLLLPGEVVETNADTIVDGRAEWGFAVEDLFEGEVTLRATSRLVKKEL